MKIAVLGPEGTFSEVAVKKYLNMNALKGELIYFSSIEESVKALRYETIDLAIVPLENLLDGFVQLTLDLLLEEKVKIVSDIDVPIHFDLLGNVDKKEDIKKVYVQFKAENQCRKIIRDIGANVISTSSNILSYKHLENRIYGEASIVPSHINDSSVPFIIHDVADSKENYTRFIILKREKDKESSSSISKEKVKVSIFVVPEVDRPWLLFDILKVFKEHSINLTAIMSRPTKTKLGMYNFYIEFESYSSSIDTIYKVIDVLKENNHIKILGIY